jgi:antitoxin component YwqK of YwqJK toxin-antitoxin module
MLNTMRDTFVPLDLLFYILAALLAYFLAIRRISSKKMAKLEGDGYKGAPALYWLRLPLILAGILIPAYYGYTLINQDSGGFNTLYYDSGEKMSEGEMRNGLETGQWTNWHENGNIEIIGYYVEGRKDSLWQWYDESGILKSTGLYDDGVESGIWMNYYPDGVVSDSGSYHEGLKEGLWKYYHESGSLKYAVNYKAGKMHGEKILLSSSGKVVKVEYFENGFLIKKD